MLIRIDDPQPSLHPRGQPNCRYVSVRCDRRSEAALFDLDVSYSKAVASSDDEGMEAALDWCIQRMQEGDRLTVWMNLKSDLRAGTTLHELVHRHSDVDHIIGRGSDFVRGRGPVLLAWADMDDIGKLIRPGGYRITALCVVSWNEEWLRPWVESAKPKVLGDTAPRDERQIGMDPVIVGALRGLLRASITTTRSRRASRRTSS